MHTINEIDYKIQLPVITSDCSCQTLLSIVKSIHYFILIPFRRFERNSSRSQNSRLAATIIIIMPGNFDNQIGNTRVLAHDSTHITANNKK